MDSVNLMRFSFKKGAHANLSNSSVQEIRVFSIIFARCVLRTKRKEPLCEYWQKGPIDLERSGVEPTRQ